jgi:general secretion pathway protein M
MKLSLNSLSLNSLSLESLAALSPRERRMVSICAVAAALVLVFGILIPLDRSVAHAQQRLAKKSADLSWMHSVAPELAGAAPPPAASGESLLVIIDRSARESGLANSLSGSEPGGSGSLSVRLEKAPFDSLVTWLARLAQQNGVTVDSATIEKAGEPGSVNAALVLHAG